MAIQALALLGFDAYLTGQWDSLAELADEGVSLCDTHSYGLLRWPHRSLQALLAAARGDSASVRESPTRSSDGPCLDERERCSNYVLHARALDAIGRGDFEDAYRDACAISPAGTIASHVPHAMWMVLDLVEAAMRTGRKDEAAAHVAAAQETGLPAISSRLALITFGCKGDGRGRRRGLRRRCSSRRWSYRVRISGRSIWLEYNSPSANGSAELGRQLARVSCSPPHSRPSSGSAPDHGRERAGHELRATGLTIGQTDLLGPASLTPQELEIAQLAAAGLTNKQIAERLFLSHRTVGTHLYQIFPKLGITSRAALRDALRDLPTEE